MVSQRMDKLVTALSTLQTKRIQLLYEYDHAMTAERLLDEHGRYYRLIDDEQGTQSTLGTERRYFLFDHHDCMRAAGSQSQIRSYIRNRNAGHVLIDETNKTGRPNDFHLTPLRYDILSPEGFSIHAQDTYSSIAQAWAAFEEWKKRFESQGYYSSNTGVIALYELKDHCKLIKIN